MANFKKRAFSLALTLTMVLSLLPVTALAAEQETMELGATYTTSDEEGTGLPTNIPENSHWVLTGQHRDTSAQPICGLEEHTHDGCAYESISEEAYDEADPACFTGSHTVYWKQTVTCGEEDHTHDRDCYGMFYRYVNFDGEVAKDGETATARDGTPIMYKVVYLSGKWVDRHGSGKPENGRPGHDEDRETVDLQKTGWYKLTCRKGRHTHTESCFTLQTGTAQDYTSTEEVTDYYRYTCGKTAHAHTEACYPMVYDWVLKSKYTENSQKVLETLPDGKASFGVFRLYKNEVPENINQSFGASLFGPSGNDVPYFTVTVDMTRLLGKDGMDVFWNGSHWYVSLDSCSTLSADQFWANVEDCMSQEDLDKFQDAFGGLYRAYVIKHESSNHMDGVMTVEPPTYTVELYDGKTLCHTNTLSKTPHTLAYVKESYETYLAETYGQGVMDWAAKTYTATQGTDDTADDVVYTVSIVAWPEENGAVKYTATSDAKDFDLAVFKLQVCSTGSLTIAKEFDGDLTAAPQGFDAAFTVQRGEDTVETFTWAQVRDGQAVLRNLPYGEVYTVTEEVTGGASVTGALDSKDGTFTHTDTSYSQEDVTIRNGNTTVTVTNTYTFTEAGKATVRYEWDTVNGVSWPETAGADPMDALTGETFYVKDGAPAIEVVPDVTALGPGYAVDGWYLSKDADGAKATQEDLDGLTDGEALTLYARLTTKTTGYQVRYDYWLSTNGGEAVHVAYGDYRNASSTAEPKKADVFNAVESPVTYQGVTYAKKDTDDFATKLAEVTADGGSWADQDLKFTVKIYGTTYSEGALTIRKTVIGLTDDQAATLKNTLVFRVYDADGTQVGEDIPYSDFEGGKYTLDEALPLGTYTVKESGGDVAGYTWTNGEIATETGYKVTVAGAAATCGINNAYAGKTYSIYFDAGDHGTIDRGGSQYTWIYFEEEDEYDWTRAGQAEGVGENQVRFAVTRQDQRGGAKITMPLVRADEGHTFDQKWTTGGEDPIQFTNLADALKAMDEAGVTSITYYADYTTDTGEEVPGGETGTGTGTGTDPDTGSAPDEGRLIGRNDTTVEVPEEDVPLAELPQLPEEQIQDTEELPEEDVPLAEVPQTGDASMLLVLMSASSGAGLAWLTISGRKRREENA